MLVSGMIRVEEYCLLEYKSQTEKVAQSMGSGFGLHIEVVLKGKLFTISRN